MDALLVVSSVHFSLHVVNTVHTSLSSAFSPHFTPISAISAKVASSTPSLPDYKVQLFPTVFENMPAVTCNLHSYGGFVFQNLM